MFLIEEVNRNVYDQRYVEHAIYRQCASVTVIRRTYRHLVERAHLQDGKLIMYVIHAFSLSYSLLIYFTVICFSPTAAMLLCLDVNISIV